MDNKNITEACFSEILIYSIRTAAWIENGQPTGSRNHEQRWVNGIFFNVIWNVLFFFLKPCMYVYYFDKN